jgi:ATP-binding cassette subfamily B multidrug efflux pump
MARFDHTRRIIALIGDERWNYVRGIGALALVNLFDVVAPLFLALAIDRVEADLTGVPMVPPVWLGSFGHGMLTATFLAPVLVYLALQIGANVFRYPMLMYVAVPSHRVGNRMRRDVVAHLLRLSRPWYDRAKSGDLMALATNDIGAVRMMLGPGILVGADTLLLVSMVLIVLLSLSWKLTLIALIPLPLIALVTNGLSLLEFRRFRDVQEDLGSLTERARESFAGIRIVQGYAREGFDRGRFAEYSWRHYAKNLRLARVRAAFLPSLDLMVGLSTALIVVFGGIEVVSGSISTGTFVAFLFLVAFLSGPMIGFGWSVSLFQRGRASLDRLDRFYAERVDIEDRTGAIVSDGPGRLEVRDLTYAYPTAATSTDSDQTEATPSAENAGRAVLRDVSFAIEPGRTVGIIGRVGSGKSTLAQLLVRMYDPPAGTVFLDGVDIRDVRLESLRRRIVLAPQETFLFSTTVARNVTLSLLDDDGEETIETARRTTGLAQLRDEIEAMPERWETMLGERGVNLSGGQRQRLAIARAITAHPDVLLLDDCLSAVDARTEQAILAQLRSIFDGRSGLIISHRVAAVAPCDEILVLDHGRIVERGTHGALLDAGGWYAQIAAQQGAQEVDA